MKKYEQIQETIHKVKEALQPDKAHLIDELERDLGECYQRVVSLETAFELLKITCRDLKGFMPLLYDKGIINLLDTERLTEEGMLVRYINAVVSFLRGSILRPEEGLSQIGPCSELSLYTLCGGPEGDLAVRIMTEEELDELEREWNMASDYTVVTVTDDDQLPLREEAS